MRYCFCQCIIHVDMLHGNHINMSFIMEFQNNRERAANELRVSISIFHDINHGVLLNLADGLQIMVELIL